MGDDAPSHFRKRPEPKKPRDPIGHNCINLRLAAHGGLYACEFENGAGELKLRVEGQLVFNGAYQTLNAALGGFGLAYVPDDVAETDLAKGPPHPGARGLALSLLGLPPLLSQPPPTFPGLCAAGRGAPLPGRFATGAEILISNRQSHRSGGWR